MKAFRSIASLAAGLSVLALVAAPTAPHTAVAAQLNTSDIDLAVARAAKTAVVATQTPAPVNSGAAQADDAKCMVKFFEPDVLPAAGNTVVFVQTKLICNDTVGDAELLIEQNDQIVVAQTVSNAQTDVSMLSATVKLTHEQEDTFCVSIARADSAGNFHVVAQECWHHLD